MICDKIINNRFIFRLLDIQLHTISSNHYYRVAPPESTASISAEDILGLPYQAVPLSDRKSTPVPSLRTFFIEVFTATGAAGGGITTAAEAMVLLLASLSALASLDLLPTNLMSGVRELILAC